MAHKGGNLTNALSLKLGKIENTRTKANTTEIPVACDMVKFNLGKNEFVQISYEMIRTQKEDEAFEFAKKVPQLDKEQSELKDKICLERDVFSRVNISFADWHDDRIDPTVGGKHKSYPQYSRIVDKLGSLWYNHHKR